MFQRLSRKTIYECDWFKVFADKVVLPSGKMIEDYHVIDFSKESVAVIIENEKEEILLIQSYRYVTNSLEWEIPAGGVDDSESILDAAVREAFEETGYEIINPFAMYSYNPSNGNSTQVFHIVAAKAGEKKSDDFDRNEVRKVKWASKEEIKRLIKEKKLKDGYSLTSLLLYLME
jgi:ADP-ribose pyrophosphatase